MSATIDDIKFTLEGTTEPVNLTDMKQYLKVQTTQDDTVISSMIKSARQKLEKFANLSLQSRTVTILVNFWDTNNFKLPYSPMNVFGSAKLKYQWGGVLDTVLVQGTDFDILGLEFPEIIMKDHCPKKVQFEYTTGFNTFPEVAKTAIMQAVADWYANRGDESSDEGNIRRSQLSKRSLDTISSISKNTSFV